MTSQYSSSVGMYADSPRRFLRLEPIASPGLSPVIQQQSKEPLLFGDEPDGIDYLCGVCSNTLLVENVLEGQFWDVAFSCFHCGSVNATSPFPPYTPIPYNKIIVPPGTYCIDRQKLPADMVIIGLAGWKRRQQEHNGLNSVSLDFALDPTALTILLERAQHLLGTIFTDLEAEAELGRRAKGTPPKDRHHLAALSHLVRQSVQMLQYTNPSFNLRAIIELSLMLNMIERWQFDPAWKTLLPALRSGHDFRHTMIMLAAADQFGRFGLDVGIINAESHNRIPDLYIQVDARNQIGIEVKTPKVLDSPKHAIQQDHLQRTVKKAFREAATPDGQLAEHQVGFLILGGFNLSQSAIEVVKAAARERFAQHRVSYQHIVAVAVISIGVSGIDKVQGLNEGVFAMPMVQAAFEPNPEYTGPVQFDFGLETDPEEPREPLIDLEIPFLPDDVSSPQP